jgi:fused signal recognition particle receptor
MTDETSEKRGWFSRLTQGLTRSSKQMTEQVVSVFTKVRLDQGALDRLEDLLIEADLGPQAAARVAEAFGKSRFGREASETEIKESLAEAIAAELLPHQGRFDPLGGGHKPYVVLFVGVNGSGKSTLLNLLCGRLRPTTGLVVGAGEDMAAVGAPEAPLSAAPSAV